MHVARVARECRVWLWQTTTTKQQQQQKRFNYYLQETRRKRKTANGIWTVWKIELCAQLYINIITVRPAPTFNAQTILSYALDVFFHIIMFQYYFFLSLHLQSCDRKQRYWEHSTLRNTDTYCLPFYWPPSILNYWLHGIFKFNCWPFKLNATFFFFFSFEAISTNTNLIRSTISWNQSHSSFNLIWENCVKCNVLGKVKMIWNEKEKKNSIKLRPNLTVRAM